MYCLACMCLCFFIVFFSLHLMSNLTALWSEKMLGMIYLFIFFNLPRLDFDPRCYLSCRIFHMYLRRNPLSFDEMHCSYQLGLSGPIHCLKLASLLVFCLGDLSIGMSEILMSPTIMMLLSISCLIVVSICFMY